MKKLLTCALLSLSSLGFAATVTSQGVTYQFPTTPEIASNVVVIQNPRIIAERINQTATEAYMNLDNNGQLLHKVVAVTSPAAEMVQLHNMYEKNGHMYMSQVSSITITPHSDTPLKDGTFHVMLIDTKKQLTPGQVIPITLIFEDGSWIKFNATVK